jgi:GNAT superfamily N-acetyltransferase
VLSGFTLRRLESGDNPRSMRSGDERFAGLKTFVQKHARKYEDEGLARTYVFHDDERGCLAAYLTMVCSEVTSEDAPPMQAAELNYPYKQWPAVKISRLLVDCRYRRNGDRWAEEARLGEALVQFALGLSIEQVCPAVGCRFVMVDAKADAVGFYRKMGFQILDTEANRLREAPVMFLDLHRSVSPDPAAAAISANDAVQIEDAA